METRTEVEVRVRPAANPTADYPFAVVTWDPRRGGFGLRAAESNELLCRSPRDCMIAMNAAAKGINEFCTDVRVKTVWLDSVPRFIEADS